MMLILSFFIEIIIHDLSNVGLGVSFLWFAIFSIFIKYKRIYHINYGYFYLRVNMKRERISIYKKTYTRLILIDVITIYDDNIDGIIHRVLKSITNVEEEFRIEENKSRKLKKSIKSWDGSLDGASRRDKNINEIL